MKEKSKNEALCVKLNYVVWTMPIRVNAPEQAKCTVALWSLPGFHGSPCVHTTAQALMLADSHQIFAPDQCSSTESEKEIGETNIIVRVCVCVK